MRFRVILLILVSFLMASCAGKSPPPQAQTGTSPGTSPTRPAASQTAGPTAIPATVTPTPEPLALKVNGESVPLSEYQAQARQLADAEPKTDPAERRKRVLAELVDETLLAQAAIKNGFSLDESALQTKIDALTAQAGGASAFADWQSRMGYTPESFRSALRRNSAAAWQRDQIMGAVPSTAEQIHARQILVHDENLAQKIDNQAKQAGTNFATLAYGYDLVSGGDLSWFPRGYLNEQAVEDAAFALQPGQISDVIKSSIGFHIIQVIARETRPLTADARLVLQRKALAAWLADARKQSQVEELAP